MRCSERRRRLYAHTCAHGEGAFGAARLPVPFFSSRGTMAAVRARLSGKRRGDERYRPYHHRPRGVRRASLYSRPPYPREGRPQSRGDACEHRVACRLTNDGLYRDVRTRALAYPFAACRESTRLARRQFPKHRAVPTNQRALLLSAPTFQLALSRKRIWHSHEFFRVDQRDRTPSSRVITARSSLMIVDPTREVGGHADVQGVVLASKDVDPWHKTTMPSSS